MHAERKPDVGSGEPQVSFRHPAASPPNILRAHVVPRVGVRGAHYDERCGCLLADDRTRCGCAETSLARCIDGCVYLHDPRSVSCFCNVINLIILLSSARAPPPFPDIFRRGHASGHVYETSIKSSSGGCSEYRTHEDCPPLQISHRPHRDICFRHTDFSRAVFCHLKIDYIKRPRSSHGLVWNDFQLVLHFARSS